MNRRKLLEEELKMLKRIRILFKKGMLIELVEFIESSIKRIKQEIREIER